MKTHNTPAAKKKKKPITAHRGRIVYEGQGRPIGGGGRPQIPRPFPGPRGPRPMPFPPRGGRRGTPISFPQPFPPRRPPSRPPFGTGPRRPSRPPFTGGTRPGFPPRRRPTGFPRPTPSRDMRRMLADRQRQIIQRQGLQAQRVGNKGMAVTKKAIGHNEFRKGGLTLSIVDNLKK